MIALVDVESSAMAVGARLLEAARGVGATVSVGVACMAELVGDGCAADEITARLRSRADAALYAARRAGRDTSRLATAPVGDCTA